MCGLGFLGFGSMGCWVFGGFKIRVNAEVLRCLVKQGFKSRGQARSNAGLGDWEVGD